jgi:hypothetical protein
MQISLAHRVSGDSSSIASFVPAHRPRNHAARFPACWSEMTNVEARMTKEARNQNVEATSLMTAVWPRRPAPIVGDSVRLLGFDIRHSFDILISSFDTSHIRVQKSRTVT